MPTVAKVVSKTAPAAVPVAAVQVKTLSDSPSLTLSTNGAMQVKTATGVMFANVGDYVVGDGNGGYIVVPASFFQLFYNVVG